MTVRDAAARLPRGRLPGRTRGPVRSQQSHVRPDLRRYTWGKLEIQALRDEAIALWGTRFSLRRFHEALLGLGAPPLGTWGDALEPA